jgi:hypothetical protein
MTRSSLLALACCLAAGASPLAAQDWRTLDVSRQVHDTASLTVHVSYAAGRMAIHPAPTSLLYQVQMRYDADRTEPLYEYRAASHTLRLGIERHTVRFASEEKAGDLQLALARDVPLDLSMELGAVEADVDLSGLMVERLHLEIGASETTVRFDTLNRAHMRSLDMNVGAASVHAERLGNANTQDMQVKIGVGSADLDFGGDWKGEIELSTQVALGSVTLRVPRDVGIRIDLQRFLSSLDAEGMVRRGDAYYSENWDTASRRLRIHAQATLGGFELDRTAR